MNIKKSTTYGDHPSNDPIVAGFLADSPDPEEIDSEGYSGPFSSWDEAKLYMDELDEMEGNA